MSDNKTTYADCTDAEIEDLLKTALATVTELSTERRSRQQKALSEAHQKLREAQEQLHPMLREAEAEEAESDAIATHEASLEAARRLGARGGKVAR